MKEKKIENVIREESFGGGGDGSEVGVVDKGGLRRRE